MNKPCFARVLLVALVGCSTRVPPSGDDVVGDDGDGDDSRPDAAASSGGPDGYCGTAELAIQAVPPNLLVMLDRSCSMRHQAGNGQPKWDVAVAAITTVTGALDDEIRWGLGLFPDLIAPDCKQGTPEDRSVTVPVAAGNALAIGTLLTAALAPTDAWYPDGPCVTNIDWAMEQASLQPALDDPDRDSFVMLVTDGKQANCDGAGGDAGTEAIIDELFQLRTVGTFVVGFGDEVDPVQLDRFAVLGGHPRAATPSYYQADDQAGLEAALTEIAHAAVSCALAVTDPPADPASIYLFVDNTTEVPRDPTHVEGWDYDPATMTLTLYGTLCDQFRAGQVTDLDLVEGCPAPVID